MQQIEADWLSNPATQKVFALLSSAPTYAVGGCVRNTLLNAPVHDIDFTTAILPEHVTGAAEAAGLRVIPTGIEHGTVTVLVDDTPFEITTFRRDVATDGRRATVAFAQTVEDDALRRDFTVNAIYADQSGHLVDPTGGLSDIQERRIRFIQDADQRIREDYLRSLRFFRFSAWYADPKSGMDPVALDAIARNLAGLETISRERVGSEMLRLLAAPNPAPAVATMRTTGVLQAVLPGADDTTLAPLVDIELALGIAPDALRRLVAIGGDVQTLRLSRAHMTHIEAARLALELSPAEAGYRHGADVGRDAVLILAASLGQPVVQDALESVERGAAAEFPVKAADLMDQYAGKELGDALKRLEARWVSSDFTLSRTALLSEG
ncbi:MAG: CCA tRNA nucleotidyltransferase [Paracoccaceae bacterium]